MRTPEGSTADRVIAALDSNHRALTDWSTFCVEISRSRYRAEILTDNREDLIEVLKADTGERPTGEKAVVERKPLTDARLAALASSLPPPPCHANSSPETPLADRNNGLVRPSPADPMFRNPPRDQACGRPAARTCLLRRYLPSRPIRQTPKEV